MNRAASLTILLALASPATAQPAAPPGAGRTAIDPLGARPGVTAPDAPLYDPVTGMPTQARVIARGRAGSVLNPPPPAANPDPFGTQTVPGLPPRAGLGNTPPAADPFTAQPGVQQMRTGTYDTTAPRPGAAPPGQYGAPQPGFPAQPGFPGQAGIPRPYGTRPGRHRARLSRGRLSWRRLWRPIACTRPLQRHPGRQVQLRPPLTATSRPPAASPPRGPAPAR